jgi:hypothetical protein
VSIVVGVVVNVVNVLDLQWSPSNIHIHPLQSADVPEKPYVMFPLNSLAILPPLSLMW